MASTAWRYVLNANPMFKVMKESREKPDRSGEPTNILDVQDGTLYVWDASKRCILAVNLKYMEQNDETHYQTLLPSNPPLHDINSLVFNVTGHLVAISGRQGISVLKIPSRWGAYSLFEGGKDNIICKTVPVAERFFFCNNKVEVVQIAWHRGSEANCHLVFLTNDNHLRIHDVSNPQCPEKLYVLGPIPSFTLMPSKPSFLGCLGDTAVAFDFGEAVGVKGDSPGSQELVWPVFILRGNGDVYTVNTTLIDKPASPKKIDAQGPLLMHPPADDNYGADACSILYLNSTPPILVIATCSGTLYHCIILNRGEEDDEDHPTLESDGDWLHSSLPQLSLYVYETVELELQLKTVATDTGELEDNCYMSLIRLHKDPTTFMRYHCSHAAGVHTVALPVIVQLESLAQKDEDDVGAILSQLHEQECIVEHLVCTKPLASSPPAPICGLAIVRDIKLHCTLLCLTSEFEILAIDLVRTFIDSTPNLLADEEAQIPPSPLRQFASEAFDLHIKKLLRRSVSNPILKSISSADISPQEGLQLVARSTQILREEYIQRLDLAREEIERRVKSLKALKDQQLQDASNIQGANEDLRNKAQDLAERYDEAANTQTNMTERVENLLVQIQRSTPVMSDAEQRAHKELLMISNNLDFFRNSIEQIKTKLQFQKQELESITTKIAEQQLMSLSLNEIRRHQLYDILNNETVDLTNLTRKINNLKRDLGI